MADAVPRTADAPGVAAYTVQATDVREGLMGIARRLYGDPGKWTRIYDANRSVIGTNPAVIRPGQQLQIPDLPYPAYGPRATGDAAEGARVYVVRPEDVLDGLAGVARRLYGSPARGAELGAVNRGVVGEAPGLLQAGQRLIVLP